MKRKFLALVLAISMAGALTACGSKEEAASSGNGASEEAGETSADKEAVTIKLAHTDPSGCATTDALRKFAASVTEKSGGRLVVEEYADGVLGDDDEVNEQIFNGAYMMNYSDPALLEPYYPNYSILFSPYFFESYDEIAAFSKSEMGQRLQQECREAGLMVLEGMSSYYGSRQIMSNTEIKSPADLKGQDFRVPNNATQIEMAESWGANPVTISFSECYSALQQGVVDCVENPIGALYANSIQEVCKYMNITNHFYAVNGLVMNTKVFESLDEDLQQLLLDEAAEFSKYNTEMVLAEEEEVLAKMEEEGCIINRDVDTAAMKETAQKVFEIHGWPQELIDEAFATLEEIRAAK